MSQQSVGHPSIAQEAVRLYADVYKDKSLLRQDGLQRDVGEVYTDDMYPDRQKYLGSQAYNEYFRHYHVDHLMQVLLRRETEGVDTLLLRRGRDAGGFRPQEIKRFARLVPHLKRAHGLALREQAHQRQVDLLCSLLDLGGHGLIVVDRGMQLLFCNAMGEGFLDPAVGLRLHNGMVQAIAPGLDRQLRSSVLAAAGGCPRGSSSKALAMRCAGLEAVITTQPVAQNMVALRIIVLSPRRRVTADLLRDLYGVTATEAAVAEALTSGMTPAEVAATHDLTLNTVRTYLKRILGKTGCSRQGDLMALLSRLQH